MSSLSATLIVYPEDEIRVITLDEGPNPTFDELATGHFAMWVGGQSDESAVAVYTRLADACRDAASRAQVRLDAAKPTEAVAS